ncbi:hypothetical protein CC79DRAFT_1361896 [Sarocladium strictum]
MDLSLMPGHDAQDSDQLQRWSPPILQDLDFGDDYDFEGSPMYPSLLDESGSTQGLDVSTGSTGTDEGEQLRTPESEPNGIISPGARPCRLAMRKKEASLVAQRNAVLRRRDVRSRAQTDRGLVPIAPRPVLFKRERFANSNLTDTMMAAGCYTFPINSLSNANLNSSPRQKRGPYAKKTCLRCQTQGKKCSGGFPCERCVDLWSRRHAQITGLAWTACFDSDIHELNFIETREDLNPWNPESMTNLSSIGKTWTFFPKGPHSDRCYPNKRSSHSSHRRARIQLQQEPQRNAGELHRAQQEKRSTASYQR